MSLIITEFLTITRGGEVKPVCLECFVALKIVTVLISSHVTVARAWIAESSVLRAPEKRQDMKRPKKFLQWVISP